MEKRVILTLSSGSFDDGFLAILHIQEDGNDKEQVRYEGKLPADPDLLILFNDWQEAFLNKLLYGDRSYNLHETRIQILETAEFSCQQSAHRLEQRLNTWLNSHHSWQKIRDGLFQNLNRSDRIRFIIQTDDQILPKLPWHLWNFFHFYRFAEMAIASTTYENCDRVFPLRKKVKILAIFGNNKNINFDIDRQLLENLPQTSTELKLVFQPNRKEFDRLIWDEKGWDILFFAGHSHTQNETGRIFINQKDSLEINDLKYALQKAIARGLHLAIFNSCDGLGLANSLIQLNIPQVIVMRFLVPDRVAQAFLTEFLQAYTNKKTLYNSVREAREKLQGLEDEIPCASWIPIIYQNPAVVPKTWQQLTNSPSLNQPDFLASECGIDFTYLRNLLAAQMWREADRETELIMLKIGVRDKETCLAVEDIRKIPCRDLQTIDRLWVKYSNGRFGLSVQKNIWLEVKENPLVFGDRIGWRKEKRWIADYYSEFDFSLNAPMGHLPCFGRWCEGWHWGESKWKSYDLVGLGKPLEIGVNWLFSANSLVFGELGWDWVEQTRCNVITSLAARLVECDL
jgi:hypothetical protein